MHWSGDSSGVLVGAAVSGTAFRLTDEGSESGI